MQQNCNGDIEIEKEIDIELEKEGEKEKIKENRKSKVYTFEDYDKGVHL
nr:hypothetical protein [Peptostreptococcus anaerobius]